MKAFKILYFDFLKVLYLVFKKLLKKQIIKVYYYKYSFHYMNNNNEVEKAVPEIEVLDNYTSMNEGELITAYLLDANSNLIELAEGIDIIIKPVETLSLRCFKEDEILNKKFLSDKEIVSYNKYMEKYF